MPYRPRVIPTAEDPLAAAITGLREGWRAAAEARRQRQLDEERRQERQFLQDLQRRQQEAREFEVYGQVLLPEPPAERQAAPRPPAAGAYVPGHGFALPRPPIEPSTAGTGSQASPIAPTAVERADPRYEEFAPGRWGRRDLLPAERAAARARQLEEERMQRLAEALAGLEHIPEASRRAIALGVPPSVAIPRQETPQRGELIQTDQGWALVNPVTGEARLLGVRARVPGEGGPKPADPKDLRREFTSDPIVKESLSVAQAYQRLRSVADSPSGANDLALIFSFMKMLDPGSVVREGEFANAENAQGVPNWIRSLYNRVLTGERLAPETRMEFVRSADLLAAGQRRLLRSVMDRYRGLAGTAGVDPSAVVFDPFDAIGAADIPGAGPVESRPRNPFR